MTWKSEGLTASEEIGIPDCKVYYRRPSLLFKSLIMW